MRIGIEACTWANQRGYGRFTRELVKALVSTYPEHDFALVLDDETAAGGGFPAAAELIVVPTRDQQIRAASADGARRLGDMWHLGRAVARARFDVYFFPTRYAFYPMTCRTPTVVAFHDATAEQHPKLIHPSARGRLFWKIKSQLARYQADRMVTVSMDAQRQIAAAFRVPEEDIAVIFEGPDPIFRRLEPAADDRELLEGRGLPADVPLILYVGGINPHKNLQGLIRALVDVPGPWHAALVGDHSNDRFHDCYQDLQALVRELGLADRVTFTGYVSDAELVRLYNIATAFVLPTLSEGFGLPVLEAMACGLPVAASDRNAVPEVLGEEGILFDPLDTAAIADAVRRLLQEPELRERFRTGGLKRAATFSWEAAARRLMPVLEAAARG